MVALEDKLRDCNESLPRLLWRARGSQWFLNALSVRSEDPDLQTSMSTRTDGTRRAAEDAILDNSQLVRFCTRSREQMVH